MWGFTCNADGEMTYDLGGKGPYVHAMSTVSRSMKETDKLRGLLCGEDNNPFHWWQGSATIIANRDFDSIHKMIDCAHRMREEYNGATWTIPGIPQSLKTILEIRAVASNDLMLIVLAVQKNAKGERDIHPFRNPLGLNNLDQQMNLMTPMFMAFFLMVFFFFSPLLIMSSLIFFICVVRVPTRNREDSPRRQY